MPPDQPKPRDTQDRGSSACAGDTLESGHLTLPSTSYIPVDAAPPSVEVDDTASRYEALEVLGEGGMGKVRLCKDRRIGREVALKEVRRGSISGPDRRARFVREARVQGQL